MKNNQQQTDENFRKTYKPFLSKMAAIQDAQKEYVVYYDTDGTIVFVTPDQDNSYEKKYLSINVLFQLISPMVYGQKSMNDYYVENGEIREKQRVLEHNKEYLFNNKNDSFVEKVEHGSSAVLLFDVDISNIVLSIDTKSLEHYRQLLNYGLVTENNLNISGSKYFTFFVADRYDPNMLIDSYDVSVKNLINHGFVSMNGEFNWDEMAIYCKQITTTKIRNISE